MKKLILLRHAKSDWHTAATTDFDRPLNQRGKHSAPLIGERLAARGERPELLLCSPAKRARQTAKKIAEQLDYPQAQIELNDDIYEASRATLIDIVQQLDDRYKHVLLIGHNPGFSELGQWLTADAPDWLPTCGLLELELPVNNWAQVDEGCAALLIYDYPKRTI